MSEIIVNSPTHGIHKVLIDDEDMYKLEGLKIYVWTSPRHHTFYAMTTIKGKQVRVHRIILGVTDPKILVDHIDGNGLNNSKSNLRLTTSKGNNSNARKRKNAITSKYKGVHYCKVNNRWIAQIQKDKVKHGLGRFKTEIEAAKAYNEAAKRLHGEFARLNTFEDCK